MMMLNEKETIFLALLNRKPRKKTITQCSNCHDAGLTCYHNQFFHLRLATTRQCFINNFELDPFAVCAMQLVTANVQLLIQVQALIVLIAIFPNKY